MAVADRISRSFVVVVRSVEVDYTDILLVFHSVRDSYALLTVIFFLIFDQSIGVVSIFVFLGT